MARTANLNSAESGGAIDLLAPDGKRLRSNLLNLGYYDTKTGESVVLAQVQDSIGQLIPPNTIISVEVDAGPWNGGHYLEVF